MTTDEPTGSMPEIEVAARGAGLGDLEVRRTHGGSGSAVVLGVLMAAAGAALLGLSAAGLAGEVVPVVGVVGMLLALLIVYTARRARNSLKEFLVLFAVAVLLGAPSFYLSSLDEDSPVTVVYALVMAAALIAGGGYIVRRSRTRPRLVESLNLFERGIVYVSPDLDGGRPTAFPWADTTLEESVTPVRGILHHTVTVRRNDGYWVTQSFNPTRRVDSRMLRRIHDVMAAGKVGPLVDQMRAGRTVALAGGLRGTAEELSGPPAGGSPGQVDALAWRDIKGIAFSDTSFIVTGKRNRAVHLPAQDARDVGVLQAVIDAMAKGGPVRRRSDADELRG